MVRDVLPLKKLSCFVGFDLRIRFISDQFHSDLKAIHFKIKDGVPFLKASCRMFSSYSVPFSRLTEHISLKRLIDEI